VGLKYASDKFAHFHSMDKVSWHLESEI